MSFRDDNDAYEAWLAKQCNVVNKDIDYKHRRMRKSPFIFLRATYFRWAKKIGDWCPELMDAPQVLSIGDLHLENFGTWRDADGRLVWGVNDFDEAAVMPYLLDLVRLATSARLAPHPAVDPKDSANALLKGYREGLDDPQPALLFEGQTWLRPYAEPATGKPEKFWNEVGFDASSIRAAAALDGRATSRLPIGAVARSCARPRRWYLRPGPGPTDRNNRRSRISLRWQTADTGRRIRFSTYVAGSFFGALLQIPKKSNWAMTPARNCSSICSGRWDSKLRRSMPLVRQASRR